VKQNKIPSGGGVFFSIKSSILCTQIDDNSTVEIVWAHIHLDKNNNLIVGSFYCPPHSSDTIFVTGFVKRGLPHTSTSLNLEDHNLAIE